MRYENEGILKNKELDLDSLIYKHNRDIPTIEIGKKSILFFLEKHSGAEGEDVNLWRNFLNYSKKQIKRGKDVHINFVGDLLDMSTQDPRGVSIDTTDILTTIRTLDKEITPIAKNVDVMMLGNHDQKVLGIRELSNNRKLNLQIQSEFRNFLKHLKSENESMLISHWEEPVFLNVNCLGLQEKWLLIHPQGCSWNVVMKDLYTKYNRMDRIFIAHLHQEGAKVFGTPDLGAFFETKCILVPAMVNSVNEGYTRNRPKMTDTVAKILMGKIQTWDYPKLSFEAVRFDYPYKRKNK